MERFKLTNAKGMMIEVSDLGAVLVKAMVPDRDGVLRDVVLGYESEAQYRNNTNTYFGSTVGRSANRIAGAAFEINGLSCHLTANEGANNLHSGPDGYQIRDWRAEPGNKGGNAVTFVLDSPDGDQGYPGNLNIQVTYTLTDDNEIRIEYEGLSDEDTVFNPTNHSYFNLGGHQAGSILDHELTLLASGFTPVADSKSIPTGVVETVAGTPMDFRRMKRIGQDIGAEYDQLRHTGGYDHNFVLDKPDGALGKAAEVYCRESGIGMEVYTDLPGIQLYAGNFLNDEPGKDGAVYGKRCGFCLETQYFPNSVNEPRFKSPVIKAGEKARTVTVYQFKSEP